MTAAQKFLDGAVELRPGDCREVIKGIPDASIDAIVTDPPYALVSIVKRFGKPGSAPPKDYGPGNGLAAYARSAAGFMGKEWDTGEAAFAVEFWAECFRVLKPGGHVAAFAGTRTYHRLACAIEDAGFEIRDQLAFCYGSGFPKSHNINKALVKHGACCECEKPIYETHDVSSENVRDLRQGMAADESLSGGAEQDVRQGVRGQAHFADEDRKAGQEAQAERDKGSSGASPGLQHDMRPLRGGDVPEALNTGGEFREVLQPGMPQQSAPNEGHGQPTNNARRGKPGLERRGDVSQASRELREREIRPLPATVGEDGKSGRVCDAPSDGDGGMGRQAADKDGVRPPQRPQSAKQQPGKPGTVAMQQEPQDGGIWPHCHRCGKPIVPDGIGTALKPAWEPICLARKPLIGTVAENVLAHGTGAINIDGCRVATGDKLGGGMVSMGRPKASEGWDRPWMHDEEVTSRKKIESAEKVARAEQLGRFPANLIHDGSDEVVAAFPDTAARFFYSAKADANDRIGSKHPTVKPVDLMQWLCRLITPPAGLILDPFAGSGTTGEAAWREKFRAILIERETEYQADIANRMRLAMAGPDERKHAIVKSRESVAGSAGPLFDGDFQ